MNKKLLVAALTFALMIILASCAPGAASPEPDGAAETAVTAALPEHEEAMPEVEEAMDETAHESASTAEDGEMSGAVAEDGSVSDGEAMEEAPAGDAAVDTEMPAAEMEDGEDGMAASDAGDAMDDEAAVLPAWQSLGLVNAATGEPFTLGGYAGKTVFVEPMATWCTNCRQQLGNVAQARQLAGEDVVFVALSLETTLDPADLARYQQDNGFDWTFAVMSEEMLQALAGEFGRSITSAPSTPHFIIRPDGSFSELFTGIDSPDELLAMVEAAG